MTDQGWVELPLLFSRLCPGLESYRSVSLWLGSDREDQGVEEKLGSPWRGHFWHREES